MKLFFSFLIFSRTLFILHIQKLHVIYKSNKNWYKNHEKNLFADIFWFFNFILFEKNLGMQFTTYKRYKFYSKFENKCIGKRPMLFQSSHDMYISCNPIIQLPQCLNVHSIYKHFLASLDIHLLWKIVKKHKNMMK